ncbi:MAG: CmcI family methyltransferase [Prosthecobacter sp.]|uniref:cephalosporin hydroxylase family protein n=1 Tax=Prosthecobacter sp. TaxID=1965333 RepID=UPI003BB1554F
MQLHIDTDTNTLTSGGQPLPLYSTEAFKIISDLWVKVGWNAKYSYTFSWLGRPIIQLPEDVMRIQEIIHRVKPDVIVETGVAHGGSLILYASLFEAMGTAGQVIGVDIEIRPHNRKAIEEHALFKRITLIEGSSADAKTVTQVKSKLPRGAKVLVILDSNHTRDHVSAELNAYHDIVSPGSYIVATDGIMSEVADAPRGDPGWVTNNPAQAAREFAATHPEFVVEQPQWLFNESALNSNVTHWPGAYLRRLQAGPEAG